MSYIILGITEDTVIVRFELGDGFVDEEIDLPRYDVDSVLQQAIKSRYDELAKIDPATLPVVKVAVEPTLAEIVERLDALEGG